MKYCNRFSYNTFKKKNSVSVIYSIEERVKINKINLFIDNVLNKKNSFIFESVEKAKNIITKSRGKYHNYSARYSCDFTNRFCVNAEV